MHLDELRDYCLAKRGAWEDQPFGPDALVFKVRSKMFAITNLERMPPGVGLKCEPEQALLLREQFEGVTTGPYLNKKHWNLVQLQGDVPADAIRRFVDVSYALVVAGLTKKEREALAAEIGGANASREEA